MHLYADSDIEEEEEEVTGSKEKKITNSSEKKDVEIEEIEEIEDVEDIEDVEEEKEAGKGKGKRSKKRVEPVNGAITLGRIGSMKRPFQEFWDLPWEACLSIPA